MTAKKTIKTKNKIPAKTPPKSEPKTKTKSKANLKPGVMATIEGQVRGATKKNPISKEDILKVLVQRFPERKADAMRNSVATLLPTDLRKVKGLNVVAVGRNPTRYYIAKRKP